jgi:enoyl-CoA hydratase/carnithine racemase
MPTAGLAPRLEHYSAKYRRARLERSDGVLQVTLHFDGASLKWDALVHEELGYLFNDIAEDPENKLVIITGEGDEFCTQLHFEDFGSSEPSWAAIHQEGRRLLDNLLKIEAPVIGVVNGPAHIHAEIPLIADIVLCAEEATFQDAVHYPTGWVPGDGCHVVWPALLGRQRASYFLTMGQVIGAAEALRLGFVNEVLPRAALLARAREIAAVILEKPELTRRYTRNLLTHSLRREMHELLSHGLGLEGLAFFEGLKG